MLIHCDFKMNKNKCFYFLFIFQSASNNIMLLNGSFCYAKLLSNFESNACCDGERLFNFGILIV